MKTYIIAEAACTWLHGGLDAARRSIHLAASCGSSAWKSQWCSDSVAMHKRRGIAGDHYKRLQWDINYHKELSEACKKEGIDYLCTVFLPQDVAIVAPYVAKFKISAFEGSDAGFVRAHHGYGKHVIRSFSPTTKVVPAEDGLSWIWRYGEWEEFSTLWCVSEYPTPLENLKLWNMKLLRGLSDHTTSVLTGAVAVGSRARIIEKHVMTHDTPHDDPDYGHSLILDTENKEFSFRQYVQNVRDAEKMMYGA